MARSSGSVNLTSRDLTRMMVVLVATAVIVGAFLMPWWTRGVDFTKDSFGGDEDGGPDTGFPGVESIGLSYGPFQTPGAGSVSTDNSRDTAVAVLGVSFLVTVFFISAGLIMRALMATGRITENHDIPVRLAIVATITGVFTVLWAGLFLPLAGENPGWLYGDENSAVAAFDNGVEDFRYANVGFFLGIVGLVFYPVYLWADAATTRSVLGTGTTETTGATTA